MPIEPHIENLQLRHPEEPLEIIRLACYLGDDIAKTKAYASILQTCNDYRDIAYKVVKDMYVKCLVDKVTAQKEKTFITFLLALCPNVKDGNPHSARYHINLMLESPEVEEEREEYARKLRNEWNGGMVEISKGNYRDFFKISRGNHAHYRIVGQKWGDNIGRGQVEYTTQAQQEHPLCS